MKTKDIVLYDAETSARFVENIKGWIDVNNRFWGNMPNSEDMARYSSCTHQKCECGKLMEKGWTKCHKCRHKAEVERYNNLPFEEWDGKKVVYSGLADKYFTDPNEITDFCSDENINPDNLRLVICIPNYFTEFDGSQWDEIMPEESDGILPDKLYKAIEEFNKVITSMPSPSYSPGKTRTSYSE